MTDTNATPSDRPTSLGRVLVTGGSGFLAAHCLDQLLRAGYPVRTTVRNRDRIATVTDMLTTAGTADPGRLEFAIADLNADDGWHEATADCRYVLHVASPFPAQAPKHEDELIAPARDGALSILRAA